MSDELPWENASLAIFAQSEADLKPLATLLRGDLPIPPGIRHIIADLVDPDGPGVQRFRLELTNDETKRNNNLKYINQIIPVVVKYKSLLAEGISSQDAAITVAGNFSISDRTVYRYVKEHEDMLKSLKGG